MKILLLDPGGFALDFALRCQDDGHEVRWFIRVTPRTENIGKGLLSLPNKIVDDWQKWILWADTVLVTDNTRYLQQLDALREHEHLLVVGASQAAAEWELDRNAGQAMMKKCGMKVAPYKEFSDYDKAIAYVKSTMGTYVSKPSGDEPDKSLTYVARSAADMVYMLERWKKAKRHKGAFILQERIKGIEMAVGGWFGPHGFNKGWHENWEFKKLFPGDSGPATGEMGTVVRVVTKSKLADLVLKPLTNELHKIGYVGYCDVNCIIGEDGTPWPLEFTMRPGWPTFNIQQALLKGDHAEWLRDLADGVDSEPFVLDEVAIGVVCAIPDFPFSKFTRKEVTGIPIYGVKPAMEENIHWCEIMAGEAPHQVQNSILTLPCYVTAGDYLLVASGTGESVSSARRKAYRILERLEIPNSPFWRDDIGQRLAKAIPLLQQMGYATRLNY